MITLYIDDENKAVNLYELEKSLLENFCAPCKERDLNQQGEQCRKCLYGIVLNRTRGLKSILELIGYLDGDQIATID